MYRGPSSLDCILLPRTHDPTLKNVLCPWTQIDSRSRPPFCRCHCVALRCARSAQRLLAARPAQGSTASHLFTGRRRWLGVYSDVQLSPLSSKTSAQRPEAARCHRPRAPPPALFGAVQQVRGGGPGWGGCLLVGEGQVGGWSSAALATTFSGETDRNSHRRFSGTTA
jgi:hypothetical protein